MKYTWEKHDIKKGRSGVANTGGIYSIHRVVFCKIQGDKIPTDCFAITDNQKNEVIFLGNSQGGADFMNEYSLVPLNAEETLFTA